MYNHPHVAKLEKNHPKVRQARRAPIEIHLLELQQSQNAGHRELFYPRTGVSLPDLQHRYGELLNGNPVKDSIEKFPQAARNRRIDLAQGKNTYLPTFTHSTGWFEDSLKSSHRYYGSNRFVLHPDRRAENLK